MPHAVQDVDELFGDFEDMNEHDTHGEDLANGDLKQEDQDDQEIQRLLNANDPTANDALAAALNFGEFNQEGKADDAVDYEDISDDDDLPEEEEATQPAINGDNHHDANGAPDSYDDLFGEGENGLGENGDLGEDDMADLFGEEPSSPGVDSHGGNKANGINGTAPQAAKSGPNGATHDEDPDDFFGDLQSPPPDDSLFELPVDPEEDVEAIREQKRLFDLSANGGYVAQTDEERFRLLYPNYNAEEPPHFGEIFPQKRFGYKLQQVLKPPKPAEPTKVTMELQQAQERSFKIGGALSRASDVRRSVVTVDQVQSQEETAREEFELDDLDDGEVVAGLSLSDLALLCDDWDTASDTTGARTPKKRTRESDSDDEGDRHVAKKQLAGDYGSAHGIPTQIDTFYSLEDAQATTMKLARRVILDMSDHLLLIDDLETAQKDPPPRMTGDFRRDISGNVTKKLFSRFNGSNDSAYDSLREEKNKVRTTLGSQHMEHSLPAVKLQYPYYKSALTAKEARSFHRPSAHFKANQTISFAHPTKKLKNERKAKVHEVFAKTDDLTLNDNSNMLLLEFSEEYPIMMSNFGMASKMLNYYRKKDDNDQSRPKGDIGETVLLMPEDSSPFSIFGDVPPGDIMSTLHTSMYRAPTFKQEVKPTDFVLGMTTTGMEGSQFYLRNIDNVHVVGQQLPSMEVPGAHSRVATDTAKKRLHALSYRIYRRHLSSGGPRVTNDLIRYHLPGTEISQNRTKMREFMAYDKEHSCWVLKPGHTVPTEETVRGMINPERVCLLDAMQVGRQRLSDAGYSANEKDNDELRDGASIEEQLAPWQTTKNFLNASQNKAMLMLHGEGDPTGRGEGFSFIKTSMKGGFRPVGESIDEKISAKKQKENGGHMYNVAKQEKSYKEAADQIWNAQFSALSSTIEPSDMDNGVDDQIDAMNNMNNVNTNTYGRTPRSEIGTPSVYRRDDETMSQFSKFSTNSTAGKILKINRTIRNRHGELETLTEVVRDPKVIKQYTNYRRNKELQSINLEQLKPTGDPEKDAQQRKRIQKEIARLNRNVERRHVREKAKANASASTPGSPGASGGPVKGAATQRKCANCGQVGHIKTNKKYGNRSCCLKASSLRNQVAPVEDEDDDQQQHQQASPFTSTFNPLSLPQSY
ncbi:hypothetical protein K402DRAFT_30707 [Aulographum hederae CBS 113979]|uniref:Transcription initiation factor TFIID subunit 1 histone acetyltransferase domain-containing protein n=1 Tax=Aulographum hederae CBS 113979 TaxID=1176131 RepID=A0A6G1H559_9PEZI|nr:hypothetical protein K402DRAFT_30707 [Aulographum hederae CBS 113979]